MFDLWARDTAIVALIAAFAILIVLPVQLILCFRAKKLLIKLLPAILLAVTAITFYIMAITAKDWSGFAYMIVTVFFGVLLIFSGIAWGIWAIVRLVKKKNQ